MRWPRGGSTCSRSTATGSSSTTATTRPACGCSAISSTAGPGRSRAGTSVRGGVRVIVHYCHNAAGMRMLGDFVDRLASPPKGGDVMARRRTGVIASPGDRRDKDIRELGEVAARHFDALIVREDRNLRGRQPGEIAELVAAGARTSADDGA